MQHVSCIMNVRQKKAKCIRILFDKSSTLFQCWQTTNYKLLTAPTSNNSEHVECRKQTQTYRDLTQLNSTQNLRLNAQCSIRLRILSVFKPQHLFTIDNSHLTLHVHCTIYIVHVFALVVGCWLLVFSFIMTKLSTLNYTHFLSLVPLA